MKKALSHIILLFIFVSQSQIGVIYAQETAKIESTQDKSIGTLDSLETAIDGVIEKLEDATSNTTIEKQLAKKEAEIEEYIAETQRKIETEGDTQEIIELVQEAKKTVILKVIAGATKQADTSENISSEVAETPKEKEEALETMTDSLKTRSGDYSLIIKSKYTQEKIEKLFSKFDDTIEIEYLYSDTDEDYYEVFIKEDSIFRKEILTDIETGELPKNFIGIRIVLPEVWGINTTGLEGENLDVTWGIQKYNTESYLAKLKAQTEKLGRNIRVGVIDTGIDYNHPDLKGRVKKGYDFVNDDDDAMDDQGHGTHVAGSIGASINGKGIIGVNPYVDFIPLKICNSKGYCPSYAVIKALNYSKEHKLDVVNMSLGGRGSPSSHPICVGISTIVTGGVSVIAASGNSNIDTSRFVPGGCKDAITVAAVDVNLKRAPFSNYGSKVDISAPGVKVYSTIPNGKYKELSGTSMATPHIVGVVSIIKTFEPNINKSDLQAKLLEGSIDTSFLSSKRIATFALPEKIIDNLLLKAEEKPEEEATIEEEVATETQDETTEDLVLTGVLIDASTFTTEDDDEETEIEEQQDTQIQSIEIDFGEENSVEINSNIDNGEVEIVDIEEVLQTKIEKVELGRNYSYDSEGKIIQSVEINSAGEEEGEWGSGSTLSEVGEGFDIYNLPENNFIGPIQESEEEIEHEESNLEKENTGEIKQILIDGAEAPVQINSAEEEESGETFKIGTGAIDFREEFLDENGDVIHFSSSPVVEITQEEINYDYEETILIDGAEAPVEINSAEEQGLPEETKLDEHDPNQAENIIIEGAQVESYDEVEKDIEIDESKLEEPIAIDVKIEQIETLEISEELLIDGAEPGVEINNAGQEQEPEEIVVEEYNENEEIILEQIDAGEIEIPEELREEFENREDDNIGETEEIEVEVDKYNPETEAEDEGEAFGTSIQNTFYCNIEVGQPCYIRVYRPYRYSVKVENPGLVSHTFHKYYMTLTATEAGESIYRMYMGDREYHTIYITATEAEPEQVYDITLEEGGNYTNIYLPTTENYGFHMANPQGGYARLYRQGARLMLKGESPGEIKYYIMGSDRRVKYLLNVTIVPKPPIGIDLVAYEGQSIYSRMNYARNHEYSFDTQGLVAVSTNYRYAYFKGLKAGTVQVYAKRDGIHRYTFNIEVKRIPEPIEYDIKVEEQKNVTLHFPTKERLRNYYSRVGNGYAIFYNYGNGKVVLRGHRSGKTQYIVKNYQNIHLYTLNVEVTPKPPEVIDLGAVYETKYLHTYGKPYVHGTYSSNNSDLVEIHTHYTWFRGITGKKAGEAEIYLKDRNGKHTHTFKIKVLPAPKPIVYNLELNPGNGGQIVLPENIDSYRMMITNESVFRDRRYSSFKKGNSSTFNFHAYRVGKAKISIWDTNGFEKYIVNIDSKPHQRHISIVMGDEQRGFSYRDDYYGGDQSIASISSGYLKGNKPGTTSYKHHADDLGYYSDIHVTVLPYPKPRITKCSVEIGQRCPSLSEYRYGYYVENRNAIDLEVKGSRTYRVTGHNTGTAKIYMLSKSRKYIKHIYEITVVPKPVRYLECATPLGVNCNTRWSGEKREYTYRVSDPKILDIELHYYRSGTKKMNSLHIRGKKVGTADVYVYERNYHVATFTITIDSPVSPIKLGNYKSRIHQGEKLQIDILNGGGEYRRENENRELVGFSVRDDTQAEEAKSAKKAKTGHINISGKKPGNANLSFKDKYGQTKRIGIKVRDTELKLSYSKNEDNELHLKGTDFEYISISEAVIGIRSYTNENRDVASIFLTRIKDSSNPGKYITIFKAIPKQSGTTKFTAYDYEGNKQEIIVRVGKKGTVDEEEEETSEETSEKVIDTVDNEVIKILEELGIKINGEEEDNEKKKLADIIGQSRVNRLDTLIDKYKPVSKVNDENLRKIIVLLKNKTNESSGTTRILYGYLHISFIIIQLERQEGDLTTEQKRTFKDTFNVYYESTIQGLGEVSEEVFDKLIEVNDTIPYEVLVEMGEKMQLIGASGIVVGGAICADGVASALIYSTASDGGVVVSGVMATGACAAGGAVVVESAMIGGVGVLMSGGGNLGKGSQGRKGSKQDKELGQGEINKLKDNGIDIHDLKPKKNGSKFDLFKDKEGNIYYKRKTGHTNTEAQYTGFNIKDF